jgi:hypothetical protein
MPVGTVAHIEGVAEVLQIPAQPKDQTEAFWVLRSLVSGRTGAVSADALARHALQVTEGADFPVRRAAMEALLRRFRSSRDGTLKIVRGPLGGSSTGLYRVRRSDSSTEYSTLLRSIDPPSGSCDCPDYGRSSLGLCKHLLAALEYAVKRDPKRRGDPTREASFGPHLEWDPVRPLAGAGDWLERVYFREGDESRPMSWAVSDVLSKSGVRSVFFTGEEGQKRRTQNLVDFHDDPSVRVLFATDAGGVGLNLQRAASCCINLELPWNPAVLEQRIGRIYRMGQSRPVEVYHLVSETGIEARIAGLVGDKRALFSGLFDGASDEVAFERSGSFLSRIERVLAPVSVPELPEKDTEEDAPEEDQAELGDGLPPAIALAAPSALSLADGGASLATSLEGVRDLFSRIEIRSGEHGKVIFEAPPQAAATLAALFEGMARMLSIASTEVRPAG